MRRLPALVDPFLAALLATVLVASLLPARGVAATLAAAAADAGIVLLFFLHGARLSRDAVAAGAANWRLHLAVLATTFLLFPLIGLAVAALPVAAATARGMVFLSLLPSTVQSSIAFTAMAGGDVAAAVCAAALSNLAGIVVTPLLVTLLMDHAGGGGASAGAVGAIAGQLLLPFALGHLLRPWIGGRVARRKALLALVDRGAILLVVYSAFSAAVVDGLWHRISATDLGLVLLLCGALLALVLAATRWIGARLFDRPQALVLLFCGSKKSLASGVPIAGALFPPAAVGGLILPLMLFHQLQLVACAVIARAEARRAVAAGIAVD